MPADEATISQTSINEDRTFNPRSRAMSDAENLKGVDPWFDPGSVRKPDSFVYVYSVVDARPDGYHLVRDCSPLVHKLMVAEIKPGQRYALVTTIPQPVNQRWLDPASNQWRMDEHSARRVAQDIVNPENLTMNQDASLSPDKSFTEGNDYGKLGVFWSLNNPPTDEEIDKAIKRKEAFYRKRLDQARALEASSPKDLYAFLTPTDHVAADYFGEEFSWHKVSKKAESCPNCGEPIKHGVAFHASGALAGAVCVIDWKRAVEAGVKKLKDVPESKRWDKQTFTGEMGE
jgi:hypothetical protein